MRESTNADHFLAWTGNRYLSVHGTTRLIDGVLVHCDEELRAWRMLDTHAERQGTLF